MRFKPKSLSSLVAIGLVICGTSGVVRAQTKATPSAEPKIVECIKNGDVACVSEFLASGGNTKAVDKKGLPLLNIASQTKSATVVRLLLNAGADPNDAGSGEAAPLCGAALYGRKEIAQALLEAGAKPDVICDADHGDNALMTAIRGAMFGNLPSEFKEAVLNPDELRESADDQDETDEKLANLSEALASSSDNYVEIARMLLSRSVDVNVVANCDAGESAMLYAAMAADVEMVRTLLAHGADVKKDPPILDFLLAIGREFPRSTWTKLPALSRQQLGMLEWMEKTRTRREEITRLLKAAGAKESERDQEEVDQQVDDQEALKESARETFSDVIQRSDIKDLEQLVAAYTNHPLGAVALPNALRSAVIFSRDEMVKLLLERGVNPNTPTADTHTPLMHAAGSGNLEIVTLLLDAGADLNAVDSKARTALDEAEMYANHCEEHRKVVALLKERGAKSGKAMK